MKFLRAIVASGALLGAVFPTFLAAQTPAPAVEANVNMPSGQELYWFLVITGVTLLVVLLVLALSLLVLVDFYMVEKTGKSIYPSFSGIGKVWAWFSGQRTKAGSIENETALDHNYDGIIELDNAAPPLFNYILYGTILFAGVYLMYYHVFDMGTLQEGEYKKEMAVADAQKAERAKLVKNNVDETNVVALASAEDLSSGNSIYQSNCAACHGAKGEGMVGPNFTDEYWINGGGIKNIFKTIKYGVPEKGMIAWQSQLNPQKMQQVASYILTLAGTNPPNAKAPQGVKYVPEADATASDSTQTAATESTTDKQAKQ
jgi:cytochrome c oxidase cbb3-type subunit III